MGLLARRVADVIEAAKHEAIRGEREKNTAF